MTLDVGAPVTGAVPFGDGVAAGCGDGTVRFFRLDGDPLVVCAHDGAVLCLASDGRSVLSGGDDGRFLRITPGGCVEEIASFGTRWVDCVAAGQGVYACSSRRVAYVWRDGETAPAQLEHPSTVGGLAFDSKSRRLAATHHRGATLWEPGAETWMPTEMMWKGLHGTVAFSPDDAYLVATTEDRMLNGWRLHDKKDFQLYGYVNKVKSFAWVGDVPHLATAGAFDAICWPFDNAQGPAGRDPLRIPGSGEAITVVAPVPGRAAVLIGSRQGEVMLSEVDGSKPPVMLRGASGAEITALAVNTSRSHVFIGDAGGSVMWRPLQV
ncbi:MAG: WD40 repeat domain-containing protein [Pseudomonadota bacterium]